jgi:hypothetical protein
MPCRPANLQASRPLFLPTGVVCRQTCRMYASLGNTTIAPIVQRWHLNNTTVSAIPGFVNLQIIFGQITGQGSAARLKLFDNISEARQ